MAASRSNHTSNKAEWVNHDWAGCQCISVCEEDNSKVVDAFQTKEN